MRRYIKLFALFGLISALTTGCAVNHATGSVDPSVDLAALKTMYVQKYQDDDDGTNQLIADKLRSKGVTVSTGAGASPSDVDAVVTYKDKWMWDITMYMLELTITIRDPKSDFPLATGNSYHTSLTRLAPKEMVNEVVDNIYKGARK